MTTRRRLFDHQPDTGSGSPSGLGPRRGHSRTPETTRPWSIIILLILVLGQAGPVLADPEYPGLILYGLDPVIGATRDPRLLGEDRMVMRQRLLDQGVDPLVKHERPTLSSSIKASMLARMNVDLVREENVTESNGLTGLYTHFRYPAWFFLYQTAHDLPGGFSYYPPRPVDDPAVHVFVDDLDLALGRHWGSHATLKRLEELDVAGGGRRANADQSLINLTIPIKLPRTLEMIIGRGEKTRIKITGREHIAIRGETTRSNQFRANENQASQSWFPDLDMEQSLQVNLTGQIGEKIFLEVDHNSEQIGPDATKIKLSFRGDEDEVIQSIETGDVGLTLPGGKLLGYQSNQSGLFGIKVTGAVGPASFATVASKRKAESDSKTFSSSGGEVQEHTIGSHMYLNNRFFRLDLPADWNGDGSPDHEHFGWTIPDLPGRNTANEFIKRSSIKIYRKISGVAGDDDVTFVAATIDTTGIWDSDALDNKLPEEWERGGVWRRVTDFVPQWEETTNRLVSIDIRQQLTDSEVLAVTYQVEDADQNVLYSVGEDPDRGDPRLIEFDNEMHYRMKLLKPNGRDEFTFQYVIRNIYSLGGSSINLASFNLRIEQNLASETADIHGTHGILYIQTHGLDLENPQGIEGADGLVDKHLPYIIDSQNGLLRFPLDMPFPFNSSEALYQSYAKPDERELEWEWDDTFLANNLTNEFYLWNTNPSTYSNFSRFRIVSTHAAASNVISLGASNIEDGSVSVTLDGKNLTEGTGYEVDYLFGTVTLLGDAAAELSPDSNIRVDYQFAPFFGGGQSSLLGANLLYDLGQDSKLSTTWLYESNSIVGHKAKLGEEPRRTLVGNVNLNHTVRTNLLTDVANIVALGHRDKESTLVINGEAAISMPNPNTRNEAYLEDFEGAARNDIITLGRLGWYRASRPIHGLEGVDPDPDAPNRLYEPENRLKDIRWFQPKTRVVRRLLNPELKEQEREETQPAVEMWMRQGSSENMTNDNWGGIMRGISSTGMDLSKAQFVEIWINDNNPDPEDRRGRLHIDFGLIDEDFNWTYVDDPDEIVTGADDYEDINKDRQFNMSTEDVGLDADIDKTANVVREMGKQYDAEYPSDSNPYPNINNTRGNSYEDSEDIDKDDVHNKRNEFFTTTIDLATTEALVDVAVAYKDDPDADLLGTSWRKYRIRLSDDMIRKVGLDPDINKIKHVRLWFEDADLESRPDPTKPAVIQMSELSFLGSRWDRDGIRKIADETLLDTPELYPDERFFIGEINNKENLYAPPFPVHEENNIPEKESSLVLDFNNLGPDHLLRIAKQVSIDGDDYTMYNTLSWWWHCPGGEVADLDYFYRVGSDSLNYYEISVRYDDSSKRNGWLNPQLDLATLTNLKNEEPDEDGVIRSTIDDISVTSSETYRVAIKGQPDLRNVKRYYLGLANRTRRMISGEAWVNDIKLLGVKKDIGMAESAGLRLNMADVLKVDFDWNHRDAEYHGLSDQTGQGAVTKNWNLSTNLRVNDFIPLFGFQVPVSFSRTQNISRPKYEINSDVEILDEDVRNELSTLDERKSYSVRLSHTPSRSAIPRYVIDPWNFSLTGSQSDRMSPTDESNQENLQGSLNYNLQIGTGHTLKKVPIIGWIPLVGSLSYLPTRLEAGASFVSSYRRNKRSGLDGTIYPETITETKPGNLTGSLEYRPLSIVTFNFNARSERDLLRRQEVAGINIGEENKYNHDLNLTFTVPKGTQLPQSGFYAPLRGMVRGLNKLKPSISYQGSYVRDQGPSVVREDDPEGIRSLSNSSEWQVRAQVPLGKVFKDIFPENRRSQAEQQRLIDEQQRRQQQSRRPDDLEGAFDPSTVDGWEDMTPDQREEEQQRWLLEQAEERIRLEQELSGAAADTTAQGGGGPPISVGDLAKPFLNILRGFDPIQVNYTKRNSSGYSRLFDQDVGLGYKMGFQTDMGFPDSNYTASRLNASKSLSVSTRTRLAQDIQFDLKYALNESEDLVNSDQTNNLSQDWPDVRMNVTGLEKLRVFGGKPDDRDAGWFRSASFDVAWKQTKNVPGFTDTYFSPRRNNTWTPRLNMNFHSGMTASINGSWSKDEQISGDTTTYGKRLQVGLTLQHQIRAQAFLARFGLYRPGNQPTVDMSVDIRYSKNTQTREIAGGNTQPAPTGTNQFAIAPRFSYNITRSLTGALNLNYSQTSNIATDLLTRTIGLGLEATFVF